MRKLSAKSIALAGVSAAMVLVVTMFARVPIPSSASYFNLGEAVIYSVAILWGPQVGMLAAAIGASLGDVLGGYAVWAPFTFVVKGLEGYLAGRLGQGKSGTGKIVLALLPAAAVMIAGYSLSVLAVAGVAGFLTEITTDLVQTAVGIIIAVVITTLVRSAGASRARGQQR